MIYFECKKLVVIGAGLIGGSLIKALGQAIVDQSKVNQFPDNETPNNERQENQPRRYLTEKGQKTVDQKTQNAPQDNPKQAITNTPNYVNIHQIVAVGRKLEVLQKAKADGEISDYTDQISQAVCDADLVVVATPVGIMGEIFKEIANHLKDGCIVTDAGSVKQRVIELAVANLPLNRIHFVPAHPVSGTEHSGYAASFASLFMNRYTIITPINGELDDQYDASIEKVSNLWKLTGSKLLTMSSLMHDKIFAATSHLPHVLVYSLVNAISELENSQDYFRVVAGGFLDYTRIASSDATMWRDICLANQAEIISMIDKYQDKLTQMKSLIENADSQALHRQFEQAKIQRDKLLIRRLSEVKNKV